MRVIGSGLVIAAYFITLHLDVVTGVIVHLTAMTISVPYFIKSRAWDVVIMMTFLMTIGLDDHHSSDSMSMNNLQKCQSYTDGLDATFLGSQDGCTCLL